MTGHDRNFYNDGAGYVRLMGRWSRLAGTIFLDWLALPAGLRWLDVGCGTGAFTEVTVAKAAPASIEGIDPSEAQIAYARDRAQAKPAHFRVGDAEALPFPESSFDVAAMALVITFVPNPAKAVAEMRRVVKPGGTVATYMWDIPGGGFPLEPMRQGLIHVGVDMTRPPGVEAARMAELNRLWTGAGLDRIEIRTIPIQVVHRDFEEFWDSNMALATPAAAKVRQLAPADIDRLKAHLSRSLPKDAQGRIVFGALANAIKGRVPG
jgi:SAM-dependent methyltransferase